MQVFLRTSVGVIILAILVAVLQPYFQQKQFCYAGIKTSAERNSEDVNCFTVSVRGTFSNVFRSSKRKDVNQGYVIPGLWDGHGHLLQYGEYLSGVDLFGSKSLADVRERLGEYMKTHEDAGSAQKWIRGVGWDQAAWGGIMPTVVCKSLSTTSLMETCVPTNYNMLTAPFSGFRLTLKATNSWQANS